MVMLEDNTFARTDVFPSWFANAIQKFLSVGAFQFQVAQVDNTHVKVPASAGDGAAVIAIAGLWRWSEADVGPVAHPGGAAGTYGVFATAKNNNIVATPNPYTDNTDYSFALQILASGATPTIVPGTVDKYRHVADVTWDGSRITYITPLVQQPGLTKTRVSLARNFLFLPNSQAAVANGVLPNDAGGYVSASDLTVASKFPRVFPAVGMAAAGGKSVRGKLAIAGYVNATTFSTPVGIIKVTPAQGSTAAAQKLTFTAPGVAQTISFASGQQAFELDIGYLPLDGSLYAIWFQVPALTASQSVWLDFELYAEWQ